MWEHSPRFHDRAIAGRQLALELQRYADEHPVILALPRGGVPVAHEVARALNAPLDVLVVRKVSPPFAPEFGVGAVAEGGVQVIDTVTCTKLGISPDEVQRMIGERTDDLDRRTAQLRGKRARMDIEGRLVIIVDDGLATGSTAHAAIRSARRAGASQVVLAVPVGSREAIRRLGEVADEVVCIEVPSDFIAVGSYYEEFPQVDDAEVDALTDGDISEEVVIPASGVGLPGHLTVPAGSSLLVLFAHGSGSSRFSPRNREVAEALNDARVSTLLMDLLTEDEAVDRRNVFDVDAMADRLDKAIDWALASPLTRHLGIALFGASTGAAAALEAAARRPDIVRSVVSRGGRPDLAGRWLSLVRCPTLLVVGGDDLEVLRLNREAQAQLRCPSALEVVPGATHLFEEPGALGHVVVAARDWFSGKRLARVA